MTRRAYVTHQKGSWKWQDRYALVEYYPRQRKRDGVPVWTSRCELDGKVKPWQVVGRVGSLHNRPLTLEECVIWALYGS
jgi:hypothetical protein